MSVPDNTLDLTAFDFTEAELRAGLSDPKWRLNNLYKIVDKKKRVITFRMNEAQKSLMDNLHTRNVILKARKLGFSTFIQILILDTAMFSPNERGLIIANGIDTAETIFRDVLKFAYDNLPAPLKTEIPTDGPPSKSSITFKNGSIVAVTTSARGRTPTLLHVSEFGSIAAKDPGKSREIITGALTSVPEDGLIFVESTAESGEEGDFYSLVANAVKLRDTKKHLWKLEFRFHFFAWWQEPAYVAPAGSAVISPKMHDYFDEVELRTGVPLSPERRAWYVMTMDNTYSGNQDLMFQEMPSYWEEAFKVSLDGAYFTEQLKVLRKTGRITTVPYDPQYPVDTFWDLGANDATAIWCIQAKPSGFAVINYVENSGEPLIYYVRELEKTNYVWNTHYIPHDANQRRQQGYINTTIEEMLNELAPGWTFYLIPRTPDKQLAIQQTRNFLLMCSFDETRCKLGLQRLESYRKQWNDRTQTWGNAPRHGVESNGADAMLQAGQAKFAGVFGGVILGWYGAGDGAIPTNMNNGFYAGYEEQLYD
jgi:hypothetical protein